MHGEPNGTFLKFYLNILNQQVLKKKNKLVLIGCKKLFIKQMKKLKYKLNLKEIKNIYESDAKFINIINVEFKFKKEFSKISSLSNQYIERCFDLALKLIRSEKLNKLINGPISKSIF